MPFGSSDDPGGAKPEQSRKLSCRNAPVLQCGQNEQGPHNLPDTRRLWEQFIYLCVSVAVCPACKNDTNLGRDKN
jgi:hypothetical protein